MDHIDAKDFKRGNLSMQLLAIPEGVRIIISGLMEIKDKDDSAYAYINTLHDQVVGSHLKLVELDLTQLSFINSTAIGTLVGWFGKLESLPKEKSYKIDIFYNSNIQWQKSGLTAIKRVAENHLRLIPASK